jgi:hypothetical protein
VKKEARRKWKRMRGGRGTGGVEGGRGGMKEGKWRSIMWKRKRR